METVPKPRLYTLTQVSRMLGLHRTTVLELVAEGRLRSVRFGPRGWHRFAVEDVERLIAGQ